MDLMRLGSTMPKIPSDSAFTQFKANLIANGTYATELNSLESCYQAIPYEFRNSDIYMLAGAYKVGQIAGYDNTGSVFDFGFSRNNIKNGFNGNYTPLEVGANIPLLDQVYYSNGILGYIIESAKTTTLANTPMINQAAGCTGSVNGFMMDAVGNSSQTPTLFRQSYSAIGGLILGQSYACVVDVGNALDEILIVFSGVWSVSDAFKINPITKQLTTSPISSITNKKMEWLSNRLVRISFLNNYQNITFGTTGLSIINLVDNTKNFGWGYFTDSASRTPIKSTATVLGSSEADIIAPILLTNSAQVCILTNKGINVINAPLGTFDINPYLTNSKLRLFTIKYN